MLLHNACVESSALLIQTGPDLLRESSFPPSLVAVAGGQSKENCGITGAGSEIQASVVEESVTESGVAADAVQAEFGISSDLLNAVRAEVGQFLGFEIAPYLLDWVRIRCIARQWLDPQPVAVAGHPITHAATAMRR